MARDPKARAASADAESGAVAQETFELAAARAAQARSLGDLGRWWTAAEQALGPSAADRALEALEAMGPDDSISWGMRACDVVRRFGGAAHIARLEAVRPRLPARKALRDWRLEAGRALAVIRARAAGQCTCAAEASHGAPVYGSQWTVESETVDRAQYAVIQAVRCACGARWTVTRQEGYHYPVFRWSRRAE